MTEVLLAQVQRFLAEAENDSLEHLRMDLWEARHAHISLAEVDRRNDARMRRIDRLRATVQRLATLLDG